MSHHHQGDIHPPPRRTLEASPRLRADAAWDPLRIDDTLQPWRAAVYAVVGIASGEYRRDVGRG